MRISDWSSDVCSSDLSVLLDFSAGVENPAIRFLGRALRDECGLDASIASIAEVPSRSLLSRLTDHYLQIIANRAPIGFEAKFVGTRGNSTRYRGILRSEEHTSELQSLMRISYAVFCLKKKQHITTYSGHT